jgi:menaquinone-dependent protoporphyrinogen oxidase
MPVLVTAASEHGATREIAARIADDLARRDIDAEVKAPEQVDDLSRYDAFVIGSAVYLGQWLKPATNFIEAHQDELRRHPTWLFSSGPIVGEPATAEPSDAARGDAIAETLHAHEHKLFGGKLDKRTLNWCEKIAVRAAHAQEGDYRDWAAIDEWAAAIAQELGRTPVGSTGR